MLSNKAENGALQFMRCEELKSRATGDVEYVKDTGCSSLFAAQISSPGVVSKLTVFMVRVDTLCNNTWLNIVPRTAPKMHQNAGLRKLKSLGSDERGLKPMRSAKQGTIMHRNAVLCTHTINFFDKKLLNY